MDKEEAREVIQPIMARYRKYSYAELAAMIHDVNAREVEGLSGVKYQIEIQVMWDYSEGGDLRVIGCIDDGGWRAFSPLTDDFLMRPDGSSVGE